MASNIIKNAIDKKLAELNLGEKDIIVLKGIPLSLFVDTIQPIKLEDICEDKMSYMFMNIYNKRQYLCYEEFLLFSNIKMYTF